MKCVEAEPAAKHAAITACMSSTSQAVEGMHATAKKCLEAHGIKQDTPCIQLDLHHNMSSEHAMHSSKHAETKSKESKEKESVEMKKFEHCTRMCIKPSAHDNKCMATCIAPTKEQIAAIETCMMPMLKELHAHHESMEPCLEKALA